jgi:hypothetical protein
MKLKMAKMNICSQFYSHIELLTKLEHVIPHFSLCMDTSIIAYKIFATIQTWWKQVSILVENGPFSTGVSDYVLVASDKYD